MSNLNNFLEYVGPPESLHGYVRSYKIILLIHMLKLADNEGKVQQNELYRAIQQFYIQRNNNNLKAELGDSDIQREIDNLTVDTVKRVMDTNPFKVIKDKGFINKKIIDGLDYIYFEPTLWQELKLEDIDNLKNILNKKLKLYYKTNLGDENMDSFELVKVTNKIETDSKKIIKHITKYILSQGFKYSKDDITNLYLCLKTKPFVLLAGISGTGKSKLVQLFAEAVGATSENERYNIIPVRPDWSDPSDLLGYRNIEGNFQPGPLTTIIKKAIDNPELPYFVCLDEMNLARVEYYFSDILSIIETRKLVWEETDNTVITDKLFKSEAFGNDSESKERYGHLCLPDNLYIVGTVNMDETTFPFSKKVLDRANTIEFNKVDLVVNFDDFEDNFSEIKPIDISNAEIRSKYVKLLDCIKGKEHVHREHIEEVVYILENINTLLEKIGLQFGYRIRDEIIFYSLYAVNEQLMDFDIAMDYSIKQKILPRIQGNNLRVKEVLIELFVFFVDDISKRYDAYDNKVHEKMYDYIKENTVKYPLCAEKIYKMVRRYDLDGFTTFWE
ncbi:MAG TPA: AAA family ATPase [Oscillospiraceae bacterium]|nr:AAA family ATPase [Oscillospiraceae bacterium]